MTSGARRTAWLTRRQKYGPRGHARGAYRRLSRISAEAIDQARDELSSARRSCQIMLPDEQAHRAITRIDRADHLLGGPLQPSLRFGRCSAPDVGGCALYECFACDEGEVP